MPHCPLHYGICSDPTEPRAEYVAQSLPEARKHADDLLVYNNTADGKGHRLVARFIAGEVVKATQTPPEWLKNIFEREFGRQATIGEKAVRNR